MSERKWFYMNNQQKEGPIAESNLCQMVSKEILAPTVLVWTDGMTNWEPASTVLSISTSPSGSVQSGDEWFYGLNDEKHGPVSESQLRSLLQNRTLNAKSLIWCEKFTDWKTVETVPEFNDASAPPPRVSSMKSPGSESSMKTPPSRASTSNNTQKSGTPVVAILVASIVLLLLVGAGITAAVFYGKGMLTGTGQNPPNGPSVQTGQSVDPGVQGTPQEPAGSSVAVTTPVAPDSSSVPVGFPPPAYVEEGSKAILAKLASSEALTKTDCAGLPAKDPNFEQSLGIMNGTIENRTGNTIWKCQIGNDDLYMIYDPTFSKMYAYEMDGDTELVADLVPSNQNASFPKEMYIYKYPSGEIEKIGILARPDAMYAFQKDGASNGYFSGTEFISAEGKSKGPITIFPSK